jgi:hypothetical protein
MADTFAGSANLLQGDFAPASAEVDGEWRAAAFLSHSPPPLRVGVDGFETVLVIAKSATGCRHSAFQETSEVKVSLTPADGAKG